MPVAWLSGRLEPEAERSSVSDLAAMSIGLEAERQREHEDADQP